MYKKCFILVLSLLLFSCQNDNKEEVETAENKAVKDSTIQISELPPVEQFDHYLTEIVLMRDSVLASLKQKSASEKSDSLFEIFLRNYNESITELNSVVFGSPELLSRISDNNDSLLNCITSTGLVLTWSEGIPEIDVDTKYLQKLYRDYLTNAMNRYLTIRGKEEAVGFTNDAALTIPWNALAERIITWERFLDNYPDFAMKLYARFWYQTYLGVYITGIDNSRIFTLQGDNLKEEVKQSYIYFSNKYPNSKSGKLVKEYLEILRNCGFRNCRKAEEFIVDNEIKPMLGVQLPVR